MKILTKLLAVLALSGIGFVAQAQQIVSVQKGHMPKKDKIAKSRGENDCVMMKGGKVLTMKDGQVTLLTEPLTLDNGTKVTSDGNVVMADGKMLMLHNGQYLLMDGRVIDESMMKGKMKSRMANSNL